MTNIQASWTERAISLMGKSGFPWQNLCYYSSVCPASASKLYHSILSGVITTKDAHENIHYVPLHISVCKQSKPTLYIWAMEYYVSTRSPYQALSWRKTVCYWYFYWFQESVLILLTTTYCLINWSVMVLGGMLGFVGHIRQSEVNIRW